MGLLKDLSQKVFRKMPLGNYIIFESVPNLSDNTKGVFDEMLKRNLNDKYKLVWWLNEDDSNTKPIKNVKYCLYRGVLGKLKYLYYKERAKCIICCNRFMTSEREGQISFYLSHGTPLKSTRSYYTLPENIDYYIAASEGVIDLISYELNTPVEKIIPLGFPRNDELINSPMEVTSLFEKHYDKVLVWYPTFRQHKTSSSVYEGNALPIISDVEKAKQLNEMAKEHNILIVLKPHFAQDISYIQDLGLSNLVFIDDNFFVKHNISSYKFVGNCDALITDYSSIYFDFTLCDKPIATVLEDIEAYKKDTGVIKEFDYYTKGAVKVFNLADLIAFVNAVANDDDVLDKERNEIKLQTNCSDKPDNSERVTDYIIKTANL